MELAAVGIICLLVGVGLAYGVLSNISNSKIKTAEQQLKDAQTSADRLLLKQLARQKQLKKKLFLRLKKKFFSLSRQQRQMRKSVRVSSVAWRIVFFSVKSPLITVLMH